MKPVKHAGSDVCYRGPSADIGDLWCQRQHLDGGRTMIEVIYEFDEDERKMIAEGGKLRLGIYYEPIPPISVAVAHADMYPKVEEHLWKEIPELREREEKDK